MKIADFDDETRKVVYLAHVVARHPTPEILGKLAAALEAFDKKHEVERAHNLIAALFGKPRKKADQPLVVDKGDKS